jgi:hypothetical protein
MERVDCHCARLRLTKFETGQGAPGHSRFFSQDRLRPPKEAPRRPNLRCADDRVRGR